MQAPTAIVCHAVIALVGNDVALAVRFGWFAAEELRDHLRVESFAEKAQANATFLNRTSEANHLAQVEVLSFRRRRLLRHGEREELP